MEKRHKYTQKEDRVIKRCVSNNIGNIQDGIREAALKLNLKAVNVTDHYYKILRPKLAKHVSLRKLIFSYGFFMLSKNKIFINGKNSAKSKIKDMWVKDETVNKLLKNV